MFRKRSQNEGWLAKLVFSWLFFALAVSGLCASAYADEDFLEPEKAFRFSAKMLDAKTVAVTYEIADGYYMYRERFAFRAENAKLGEAILPQGKIKFDETFQKEVETYRHNLTIELPVEAAGRFSLTVTSQGCSDKGLCYAPMDSTARLSPTGTGDLMGVITNAREGVQASSINQSDLSGAANDPSLMQDSETSRIQASLKSGKMIVILPLFFLLGLGLSLTPCVLPMVPILSSIIVGEGTRLRRTRGFILSAAYSLGMALIYTALGIAAGLAGEGLGAELQNPWALSIFAMIMVILSLSMFGVYQLQVPAAIQAKLLQISSRQEGGKLLGVFAMGAISALIVGPCVAAPLAGILVYIGQTRDVVIGGSALFAMAMGMSVPLLLVGISAGTLLPRSGPWMELVKRFFGVLLLAVALWMVSPFIPATVQMLGWTALGIGYGSYMLWMPKTGWLSKALGMVFVVFGVIQFAGVMTGSRDALSPLAHLSADAQHKTEFKRVQSIDELDAALAQAKGKVVMLDFYADWCVSCKEMEKFTFSDPRVHELLAKMQLLQIDVTANNADDKAMLRRFNLFGPPGIIFFDRQGQEIPGARVIGYQNAEKFLASLERVNP